MKSRVGPLVKNKNINKTVQQFYIDAKNSSGNIKLLVFVYK